jgi:hypothetical protein
MIREREGTVYFTSATSGTQAIIIRRPISSTVAPTYGGEWIGLKEKLRHLKLRDERTGWRKR